MSNATSYTDILKRKYERPKTNYTPEEVWAKAYDYFQYMNNRAWHKLDVIKGGDLAGEILELPIPTPYSIESFCIFANISVGTFIRWTKDPSVPEEMKEVVARIRSIIDAQYFEGGMTNTYHAGLTARKLGLAERQDITSGDEKLAPPVIVFKKTEEPKD